MMKFLHVWEDNESAIKIPYLEKKHHAILEGDLVVFDLPTGDVRWTNLIKGQVYEVVSQHWIVPPATDPMAELVKKVVIKKGILAPGRNPIQIPLT